MSCRLHATATLSQGTELPAPTEHDSGCAPAPGMQPPLFGYAAHSPVTLLITLSQLRRDLGATLKFQVLYIFVNGFFLCFAVVFMVDEEDHEFDGMPSLSPEKSDERLCGAHSVCTPIKSCTLLQGLMEQSCLASEN